MHAGARRPALAPRGVAPPSGRPARAGAPRTSPENKEPPLPPLGRTCRPAARAARGASSRTTPPSTPPRRTWACCLAPQVRAACAHAHARLRRRRLHAHARFRGRRRLHAQAHAHAAEAGMPAAGMWAAACCPGPLHPRVRQRCAGARMSPPLSAPRPATPPQAAGLAARQACGSCARRCLRRRRPRRPHPRSPPLRRPRHPPPAAPPRARRSTLGTARRTLTCARRACRGASSWTTPPSTPPRRTSASSVGGPAGGGRIRMRVAWRCMHARCTGAAWGPHGRRMGVA